METRLEPKLASKAGLILDALGFTPDLRNSLHICETMEAVIRVSARLEKDEKPPTLEAAVWGNNVKRMGAESTNDDNFQSLIYQIMEMFDD
ncbi:MAG: hypothetical protein AAB546_04895 [Patescibacteria group bacterium]